MSNRGRKGADASGSTIRTILLASLIAVVLASSVALVAVARTIDMGPRIGDILVFRPGALLPLDWEFPAVTQTDELPISCKLQPSVMASAGGSLVVEERLDNRRTYLVHWAGKQTSNDGNDCGKAADLLVSRVDLQLMSNAVGGPGVEHSHFLWF